MDYFAEIQKEYPFIKAHEEDDEEWYNEGVDFLKDGSFSSAEVIFKRLCLSQPKHFDGFEGLACLYSQTGQHEKAIWFMEKAVELAKAFIKEGTIDRELIDDMESKLQKVKKNKVIRPF